MGDLKLVSSAVARWSLDASEGRYMAGVKRERMWDRYEDGARRQAWRWILTFKPTGGHETITTATPVTAIYTPDLDHAPAVVLATLASFVSAWNEAQRYEASENRDLFPESCLDFLGCAEEFSADMDEYAG